MKHLYKHLPIAGIAIITFFFVSCAGAPDSNPMLQQAQTAYQQAENDTLIVKNASVALQEANETLAKAQKALNNGAKKEVVDHQAYMAQQRVKIARQTAMLNAAQDEVKQAQSERQQVLIEARQAEAEASEQKAKMAQNQAEMAQDEAAQQQEQAEAAKKEAMAAQQKAQELAQRIKELEAQKTARGLVLTLGDVLFDVDKANLKSGGDRAVQKLAAFLNDYPKRNVMIEGYTDNTGSDSYNQQLSERRADAVRQALMNNGIEGGRIQVRGYGEQYPVANNNTQAGRQRNRRVEVVISDKSGVIPERGN